MKTLIFSITMMLSLSAVAGSGTKAMSLVLEQPEVESLEARLQDEGFTLSKVQDVFATGGFVPRCPCTSLDLTFSRVSGGRSEVRSFNVTTRGFGTSLDVTIKPNR